MSELQHSSYLPFELIYVFAFFRCPLKLHLVCYCIVDTVSLISAVYIQMYMYIHTYIHSLVPCIYRERKWGCWAYTYGYFTKPKPQTGGGLSSLSFPVFLTLSSLGSFPSQSYTIKILSCSALLASSVGFLCVYTIFLNMRCWGFWSVVSDTWNFVSFLQWWVM